jgi:hypothetical protein
MKLRPLSAIAGLALAGTALVAVPAPAEAAAVTSATHYVSRTVNEVGPANCNVVNNSSNSSGPFTSNGVAVSHSVSGTTNIVDTGDASDTSSIATSSSSTVRMTEAGGSMRRMDVSATLSATFNVAQGAATDCDAQAQVGAQTQLIGVLTRPKWVVIDAEVPSGGQGQVVFQRSSPVSPPMVEIVALVGNSKGRSHAEVFLPAGTYQVATFTLASWNGPAVTGDPTAFTAKPFLHMLFERAGIAKGKASGNGTKYLKLKSSRKCASDQLRGTFTSAAGVAASAKINKAIFTVNGKKSKTVNLPEKNTKVTLTNLPSAEDITVSVQLKLFGGGSAKLTRDYRSCT